MGYSFSDFTHDFSSGLKDVFSIPKSIFGSLQGDAQSFMGQFQNMFGGQIMQMLLPIGIVLIVVLLIFKLI